MGDQKNADPLALDQRHHVAHHTGAHNGVERSERLVHQDERRLQCQDLRQRHALALAAAQATGKSIAEAAEIEPLEPCLRLGQGRAALGAVEKEAERDVVARGLPRQQRIILEQDADLRARELVIDRTRERLLQPDHGSQQARFARARRSDKAHETAFVHGEARSLEHWLPAVGNRQVTDAQVQPPTIEVSCSPDMLAPGLIRPPATRLCSTRLAASRSICTVSG
jgi:hypothetical protein